MQNKLFVIYESLKTNTIHAVRKCHALPSPVMLIKEKNKASDKKLLGKKKVTSSIGRGRKIARLKIHWFSSAQILQYKVKTNQVGIDQI